MNRNDPDGIRTRVTGVKGQCPRPLDDGAALGQTASRNCYIVLGQSLGQVGPLRGQRHYRILSKSENNEARYDADLKKAAFASTPPNYEASPLLGAADEDSLELD